MKNFNYLKVGNINILPILNKITNADWDEWTYKQDTFEAHSKTKNLTVITNEKYNDKPGLKTSNYRLIEESVEIIKDILKVKYGEGKLTSIEIAKLPAGAEVARHIDKGYSLESNPRIHLVLQTNNDVIFTVDGEDKNMKVGELWEINNTKKHSVRNKGNIDRIHMIIDYKQINSSLI